MCYSVHMCFSPTASFSASIVLGAVGTLSVAKNRHTKALPLAAIPIIFAIQQAIEGFLWLNIRGSGQWTLLFTHLFLFFALFWWPIFAPIAVYLVEPNVWRRHILKFICLAGILLGCYLYATFLIHPAPATVVQYCIYYPYTIPYYWVVAVVYLLVIVGAGLLSSYRVIQITSFVMGVLAFISWRIYLINFTSVWCFFAAIASVMLYYFQSTMVARKKVPALKKLKI